MRYSSYGINAVLDEPLDRQSVLKVVRATHLLVIHELRRYVRIPVASQVEFDVNGRPVVGTTVEVSSGGISIRCLAPLPKSDRYSPYPHAARDRETDMSGRLYAGTATATKSMACALIPPTSAG